MNEASIRDIEKNRTWRVSNASGFKLMSPEWLASVVFYLCFKWEILYQWILKVELRSLKRLKVPF
jgi:hypothetical protein